MNNRRFYKIGLFLSIALFIAMLCMPKTMGSFPAIIGLLSLACIPIFLIALIVSGIRAKKKSAATPPAPSAPIPSAPSQPTTAAQSVVSTPPAPTVKRTTNIERVHVRGVDHYTKNVESVGFENPDYNLSKRELQEDFEGERVYQYTFDVKADLVPEPDNEYDPNAIMVQANGLCIGHVPKGSTAHIRKLMESGRIKSMNLNIGGGKYKEVYEVEDGKYELDKDALKYSAVLELHLTEE